MDILHYINSSDVRHYLEETNYSFTPVEAAWIIARCERITLQDRHDAWQEIINTMPDCRLESIAHYSEKDLFDSLHTVLRKMILIDNRILSDFYHRDDNSVYQYAVNYCEDNQKDDYNGSTLFSQFNSCFETAKKIVDESDKDEICSISIRKNYIDCEENSITLHLDLSGSVTSVYRQKPQDEDEAELLDVFDRLWLCIPAPFKKGDIVWHRNRHWEAGPIVVDYITPEYYAKTGHKGVDSSDMNIYGYFQNDSGEIYHDVTFNYMDFEYYPKEKLIGKKRILTALSNYLKGEIGIELFSMAYHHILLEEQANSAILNWYTEEGLNLAGLGKEEKSPYESILRF